MLRYWMLGLFALLLTACQAGGPGGSPDKVIPKGHGISRFSARPPTVEGDTLAFTVFRGDCSALTYGDGRGESDCLNKNTKSQISGGNPDIYKVGATILYAFDVRIGAGLTHAGHHQPEARRMSGPGINNSRLEIARWQGEGYIKNHIYDVEVDTTRGITFLGRRCAGPSELSDWTRFEMRVRWADDDTGWIDVRCNGRQVYARTGIATNQAPHCHVANHCEPGVFKNPKTFNHQFGILFDAEFLGGRKLFPRIPDGGLTIHMRDFDVRRL